MIESKPLIALVCLMASLKAFACRPLGLNLDLQFEKGSSTLSASNVKRFADWQAEITKNFQGKGIYLSEFKIAPYLGTPLPLVKQREQEIKRLLKQFGVPQDQLQIRTFELKSADSERAGVVGFGFEPDCPNPCCLGPEPINSQ